MYIYIYIYMCVCVCTYIYTSIAHIYVNLYYNIITLLKTFTDNFAQKKQI